MVTHGTLGNKMVDLRNYLANIPSGPINAAQVQDVKSKLAECWEELKIISDDAGMKAYKLNRAEGLAWLPPFLTFGIERHGATVKGSIYGELHAWKVNVETGEAYIASRTRRQIHERDASVDVEPLAQEIAALIVGGKEDNRLARKGRQNRVQIAQVIPKTIPRTISARRKRFRVALTKALADSGWRPTTVKNTYERDHR